MSAETTVDPIDFPRSCLAAPDTIAAEKGWDQLCSHVTADGTRWVVGTTGHILAAIHDEATEARSVVANAKTFETWLTTDPGDWYQTNVETLRAWAGPGPEACDCPPERRIAVCQACDGEGEVECGCSRCGDSHMTDCRVCNGTGGARCPRCENTGVVGEAALDRIGSFRGRYFNRRLLARLFQHAPSGPVELTPLGDYEFAALLFRGEGWRALAMPVRRDGVAADVAILPLEHTHESAVAP